MNPTVRATAERAGERLDVAVASMAEVSRSQAARLVDAGHVRLNGRPAARSVRVSAGDKVEIDLPDPVEDAEPIPQDIPIPVVHEDAWLLVVDKPAGLVVHPAPGHASGTLVNALIARTGRRLPGEPGRPGIVHRLDAGTSGLMIVALDGTAHERLRRMLSDREVSRTYLALVEGAPPAAGTIDAQIGRSSRDRKKMAVVAEGREAVTDFTQAEALPTTALLEVKPRTGRTHQIRVHLAGAGYPIVGDRVYGRDRKLAKRLELERPFLHASGLAFSHPITGEPIALSRQLPDDLQRALALARTSR